MKYDNDKFYGTQAWRDKAKRILRRDAYTDQLELRAGRHVPATLVHHILPRAIYPEYSMADWNLISISEATHRELHTMLGGLTDAGKELMRRTARANGVRLSKLTLVVGLPGTGKVALVKRLIKDGGLAYSLDELAQAFRLGNKDDKAARRLANSMVKGFASRARDYTGRAFIIRTAPSMQEVEAIEPDELIVCKRIQDRRKTAGKDWSEEQAIIDEIQGWAEDNNILIQVIE